MGKKDGHDKDNMGDDFESITPDDLGDSDKTHEQIDKQAGVDEKKVKSEALFSKWLSEEKLNQSREKIIQVFKQFFQLVNDLLDLKDIKDKLPPSVQEKLPDNPRLLTLPVFIFLLGLLLIIVLALFAPTASKRVAEKAVPVVRVVAAKKVDIRIPVFSQGLVEPKTEIQMVSLVNGPVLEVSPNLVDGGKVEEGELLVRISDRSYIQDKARAQANLARAKSAQIAKQSELRVQGTLRTTSGTAQLIEVNSAVSAAEADLERVTDLIENTEIKAPFSGVVRRVNLQKGQVISAGTPIASLFSTEAALLQIPLADRQLSLIDRLSLSKGAESERLPDVLIKGEFGNTEYYWQGKLIRLAGARNELNRLQYATVEIAEPYADDPEQPGRPKLTPGFFVQAEVSGKLFKDIVRLPRKALKTNERIWGVDGNNLLTNYDAQLIHRDREHIYVTSGIENNEQVVISELEVFVQGIEVRPKLLEQESQEPVTGLKVDKLPVRENQPSDAHEPMDVKAEKVEANKAEAVEETPEPDSSNNKADSPES